MSRYWRRTRPSKNGRSRGNTVDVCIMCDAAKARAFRQGDKGLDDDADAARA